MNQRRVERRTREGWRAVLLGLGIVAAGCSARAPTSSPGASASAAVTGAPAPVSVDRRAEELLSVEHRRASAELTPADLSHANARLRGVAARTLARIADARSAELLLTSLSDADPTVLVWSAYGLGYACSGHESVHVRALVTRAASLLAEAPVRPAPAAGREVAAMPGHSAPFDPLAAIADALGRCGGPDAEHTLRAWATSGAVVAEAAGFALGTLASRHERLEDATLVALLDAASHKDAPVASALQAFTRLPRLDDTVRTRLLAVARAALGGSGLRRAIAVRALGAAGAAAAAELANVVRSPSFTPAERADAVRGLARLGPEGQTALGNALAPLADEVLAEQGGVLAATYGVLSAALGALETPERAGPALSRVAGMHVDDDVALKRRQVALRCAAASVLAGRGSESAVLARCDPDPAGRAGRLALVRVLDRGPLRGQRLRLFQGLTKSEDAVVRERALELIATHPELERPAALAAEALGRKTAGDVATAARLVADHPGRFATDGAGDVDRAVAKALGAALAAFAHSPSIEVRSALDDAAGAVALLSAKPGLEADCRSDNPTLRSHAEKALQKLGNRGQRCVSFEPSQTPPRELAHLARATTHVTLETDSGTVTLDLSPDLAPVAVTRLVELAREGFFNGVTVHRVVPGFVVQLGDRDGDGYGGVERPPLRCETSPAPFDAGSVGIALSGRDTGSSQFFVTLAREPHLDGDYALVGRAGPGWDKLAEGDVVHKVTVSSIGKR